MLGIAINAARFRRRRLAIAMAWVVGVLTVAGVIIAILSSVHGARPPLRRAADRV